MNNPYNQYQINNIMTAPPAQLTLMLYNGCIRFCNQAIEALEAKNYEKAHRFNLRVQDIIVELQATLDPKYDIATQLNDLYEVIKNLLIDANIEKDINKLGEVHSILVEFRDLWQQVMKQSSQTR